MPHGGAATRERVREILTQELGLDPDFVQDDHRLVEDLDTDSLDLVELVITLEEEFETELADETVEKWVTVDDVCRALCGEP